MTWSDQHLIDDNFAGVQEYLRGIRFDLNYIHVVEGRQTDLCRADTARERGRLSELCVFQPARAEASQQGDQSQLLMSMSSYTGNSEQRRAKLERAHSLESGGGRYFRDIEKYFDIQEANAHLNAAIEQSHRRDLGLLWKQFFRDLQRNLNAQYLNLHRRDAAQRAQRFEVEGLQRIGVGAELRRPSLISSVAKEQLLEEGYEIYVIQSFTKQDLLEFERSMYLNQQELLELFRFYAVRVQIKIIILNYQDWMVAPLDTLKKVSDAAVLDVSTWRVVDNARFRSANSFLARIDLRPESALRILVKSKQEVEMLSFSKSDVNTQYMMVEGNCPIVESYLDRTNLSNCCVESRNMNSFNEYRIL